LESPGETFGVDFKSFEKERVVFTLENGLFAIKRKKLK